jgi:hypothetical protein
VAAVLGVELIALAGAAQSNTPDILVGAFDLSKSSASVLTAAVFGLTPGLVLDRLNQRAEGFKENLHGSAAPSSRMRRSAH